jgi:hypothetical protein
MCIFCRCYIECIKRPREWHWHWGRFFLIKETGVWFRYFSRLNDKKNPKEVMEIWKVDVLRYSQTCLSDPLRITTSFVIQPYLFLPNVFPLSNATNDRVLWLKILCITTIRRLLSNQNIINKQTQSRLWNNLYLYL